jgi:hypothetical protein
MSLLKTKPAYAPNAVATDRGWTNPVTGEVLIAIGMLKTKLDAEQVKIVGATADVVIVDEVAPVVKEVKEVKVEEIIEPEKEIVMEPVITEVKPVKVRKEYTKKQIIGEVVEHVEVQKQIIGEVVEHIVE